MAKNDLKSLDPTNVRKRKRCRRAIKRELHDSSNESAFRSPDVGQRLRLLRSERNLTLRMLADLSGLNINTLSMIENGRSSPSVATIQQLASSLQLPMMAFFEEDVAQTEVICLHVDQRPRVSFSHGLLEELGAGMSATGAQPFLVHLQPGAVSGDQPIVHTGLEFVFCLAGSLEYQIDRKSYSLSSNDSLFFEAHLPHTWRNNSNEPARMILMLCDYGDSDHPVREHFSSSHRHST